MDLDSFVPRITGEEHKKLTAFRLAMQRAFNDCAEKAMQHRNLDPIYLRGCIALAGLELVKNMITKLSEENPVASHILRNEIKEMVDKW